jgi:guanylate kinase
MAAAPVLLILAGPAGSGKSTLCDRLVDAELGFSRVITTTTRAPRVGEIDGVHYHFFSASQFDARAANGEFLEWAWVHGDPAQKQERRYGTLRASVEAPLRHGQDLVMSVDVQGVASFRKEARTNPCIGRSLVTIFIRVDHERLLERMRRRGKDNEAEIARRMATAEAELREAPKFDHIIDSKTRDEDFAALLEIVEQERAKRKMAG